MDTLVEFIALTVYALAASTVLVLMSRPVRWVLRRMKAEVLTHARIRFR